MRFLVPIQSALLLLLSLSSLEASLSYQPFPLEINTLILVWASSVAWCLFCDFIFSVAFGEAS